MSETPAVTLAVALSCPALDAAVGTPPALLAVVYVVGRAFAVVGSIDRELAEKDATIRRDWEALVERCRRAIERAVPSAVAAAKRIAHAADN